MAKGRITQLLNNNKESCLDIISNYYPHNPINVNKRAFSLSEKMTQFIKDGFIDRYTGEKLVNPGILKVISFYFPDKFSDRLAFKCDKL